MSKLKEMKKNQKEEKGFDFTYVFLAAAGIVVVAIVYFSFFAGEGASGFDMVQIVDSGHVKGGENAKVTIVEFSDFQCPACGAMYPVLKRIESEYGDKIKFVYRHFPLTSIHPFAEKAAEASECAALQGKFWEYHDKLFENQKNLEVSELKQYAVGLSLDFGQFNKCLDSGDMVSKVAKDGADAKSLGSTGTPTFFINGYRYSGMAYEQLKQVIDRELAK